MESVYQKFWNRPHLYCVLPALCSQINRLLDNGYSKSDIAQTIRKVRKARHARDLSVHNQKWDHFHEVIEQTTRKFKKSLSLKKRADLATLAPLERMEDGSSSIEAIRPVLARRPKRTK
jgi:hypothetical protein